MTSEEREPGGSKKDFKDEFEEATKMEKDSSKDAVEEEEATGSVRSGDESDEASRGSDRDS